MLFVVQILDVAVCRATISGCCEPNPVQRDLDGGGNLLPCLLSGSGESENVRISLAECGSEQPEFVEHKRLQKNQHHKKTGVKSPLVKVLKVLRKLSQKFSKQGLGQSPEVFPKVFPKVFSSRCFAQSR